MRKCKFLTNAIYVDPDNIKKYIDEQYEKFKKDFIDNTTYVDNLPIKATIKVNNQNYGEILTDEKYTHSCFAHIVSKKINKNSMKRKLDLQRLMTCHWLKELIEYYNTNSNCQTCRHLLTKKIKKNKEDLLYIFCDCVRYLIILKKIKENDDVYYIVKTAYYIDSVYETTDYAYHKKLLS